MHNLNSKLKAYTLYVHYYTDLDFKCPILNDKEQGSFYNQQRKSIGCTEKNSKKQTSNEMLQISSTERSQAFDF